MLDDRRLDVSATPAPPIRCQHAVPPVDIPPGHVGPVVLPGSGRTIWWTGRVAIGLRHQPQRHFDGLSQSAIWVQDLLLQRRGKLSAA